jgi:hypothetical protein
MWFLLALACGYDDRLLLDIPFFATPAPAAWTLDDGTAIALTVATVELADVRLESPAEAVAWSFSLLPTALAHPGHDFAGDVGGELLGTFRVDLLADEVQLGVGRVYEGDYATGRVRLTATPASFAGTVTLPDQTTLPFRFEPTLDREVTEIDLVGSVDEAAPPRRVDLTLDAAAALSFVDWTTSPGADGALDDADGALSATVPFGVAATPAWHISFIE